MTKPIKAPVIAIPPEYVRLAISIWTSQTAGSATSAKAFLLRYILFANRAGWP